MARAVDSRVRGSTDELGGDEHRNLEPGSLFDARDQRKAILRRHIPGPKGPQNQRLTVATPDDAEDGVRFDPRHQVEYDHSFGEVHVEAVRVELVSRTHPSRRRTELDAGGGNLGKRFERGRVEGVEGGFGHLDCSRPTQHQLIEDDHDLGNVLRMCLEHDLHRVLQVEARVGAETHERQL